MMMKRNLHLIAMVLLLGVAGCSQSPKEEQQGWNLSSDDLKNLGGSNNNGTGPNAQEEGPQYQQPNMDVLKGKMQKFPAKFPIQRYPNSRVALVDVRPNRGPGANNMVMLRTDDNIPVVGSFYKDNLAKDSWKKISEYENSIYESSTWEKGNLRCEVRVAQDFSKPEATRIVQLLYGIKPKQLAIRNPVIPPQNGKFPATNGIGSSKASFGNAPNPQSFDANQEIPGGPNSGPAPDYSNMQGQGSANSSVPPTEIPSANPQR
jgi:hypothetical protein